MRVERATCQALAAHMVLGFEGLKKDKQLNLGSVQGQPV